MGRTVKADQIIRKWGNGLAVQITAPVAKAAIFARGQPVTVGVVGQGILISPASKPRLTLAQKLKAFDSEIHGGEAMMGDGASAEVRRQCAAANRAVLSSGFPHSRHNDEHS